MSSVYVCGGTTGVSDWIDHEDPLRHSSRRFDRKKASVALLEFLYTVRPTQLGMLTEGPTEEESAIIQQHAEYIKRLASRGVVELAGRTQNADETAFGLVIFRAENEEAALQIMREDPVVRHGVMNASLFPYRVAYRTGDVDGTV